MARMMQYIHTELVDDVKEVHGVGAAEEEDHHVKRARIVPEGPMQKSVSAECLSSMDWINGCGVRPNFLGFQGLDFGAAFGMRRAYSEGDIQVREKKKERSFSDYGRRRSRD